MKGIQRLRVEIEGIVQGVGFRPFVYRLAEQYRLAGWVRNMPRGVLLEAEGPIAGLTEFCRELEASAPPLAVISAVRKKSVPLEGRAGFAILESAAGAAKVQIAPDGDVCTDCLRELLDPADRRFRYPFINCTNCGPRYSIITGTPYDRPATTMAAFAMCPACLTEYHDPADRRFHAQPNACPVCGPRLRLVDRQGGEVAGDALAGAVRFLTAGKILAIKGTGGYHLAVDACNDAAVAELRRRKARDEKPFALLAADLAAVARFAHCDQLEERLLTGVERPIVLLGKAGIRDRGPGIGRPEVAISPLVAPANGYYGVMLPSTPLQYLLLGDGAFAALVLTSGNLSDEPIAYRDEDAMARLGGVADYFLSHDREIHTRTDDSVLRVFRGNPLFLRRSRGYVPRGIALPLLQRRVLAVGAELKGAICLASEERGFMSQHIGDLQNAAIIASFEETVTSFTSLLQIEPEVVAHDLHPDYLSTVFAAGFAGLPKVPVQHHHAHMASCMAENGLEGQVIGVIFDGTGYGPDGTIWGGEFLLGDYLGFRRVGHFRQLPMPGGDAAVREPYRMAIAALHQLYGADLFELPHACLAEVAAQDRPLFIRMLERGINSPLTSSCGRLIDAVAALLDVRHRISYEGQAAIELEALAEQGTAAAVYPYELITDAAGWQIDFAGMVAQVSMDARSGRCRADIARTVHATLAMATVGLCGNIRAAHGTERVVLSGGVFQNRLLTEEIVALLIERGFQVFVHRLVPPNDGGVALGQAMIAGRSQVCA